MITIENAKLIVSEFNSDLNKLNFIINNQVIENADSNTDFGGHTFKGAQKKITSIKTFGKNETATYAYRENAMFLFDREGGFVFCDSLAEAQALLK